MVSTCTLQLIQEIWIADRYWMSYMVLIPRPQRFVNHDIGSSDEIEQPTVADEEDFAQILRRNVTMEFQQNENLTGLEVE